MSPARVLVLGGAASGKSEFAEELVAGMGPERLYVASAEAGDAEMARKIARHVARRGPGWHVVEAPRELGAVLDQARPVLFDCATMWLANHLFAGSDLAAARDRLLADLDACPAPVVTVSNEVGQGIVPAEAETRRFREAQGRLNIALAARADCVVQVVAGLPNVLKGTLP